jgi:hypothetical protein
MLRCQHLIALELDFAIAADLSDALMDRAVIVDANLRNALLQRVVLTRSDLARSDICEPSRAAVALVGPCRGMLCGDQPCPMH